MIASVGASSPDLGRERFWIVLLAAGLTVLRSLVLVLFEGARFDSDQALFGLMAKHLVEGRSLPAFTYGQPYMLGIQSWLAAPFFLIGGPTVQMLKLPLLLVNVAAAVLVVLGLERYAKLRPRVAIVPALFFVLAPPGAATLLLDAGTGGAELCLVVALLWVLRHRPVAFGALLALGTLQREFALYALGALAVMSLVDRSLFRRAIWPTIGLGAVGFAAVWQGAYLLKQFSSVSGPGTSSSWQPVEAAANLTQVVGRLCVEPASIVQGARTLASTYLAEVLGAVDRPLVDYMINSHGRQGADWLWPVVAVAALLMGARVTWLSLVRRASVPRYAIYLLLVGVQALTVHALLWCGAVSLNTMRYSLLGLYGMVGLVAAFLAVEPRRVLRWAAVVIVLLWAAVSAVGHGRLAGEYLTDPPVDGRRQMAAALVERGVRYAYADFWNSYSITFLAQEQVIVASTGIVMIDEYQWLVERRLDEAVRIDSRPCVGGEHVADGLYVCPPAGRTSLPKR